MPSTLDFDVPLTVLDDPQGRKFVLARDLEEVLGYKRTHLVCLISGKWSAEFHEGVHYGYASKGGLESAVRRAGNPESRGFGSRNMILYAAGVRLARDRVELEAQRAVIARQALAKLSPAERQALGA